jgi:hypothetical protein
LYGFEDVLLGSECQVHRRVGVVGFTLVDALKVEGPEQVWEPGLNSRVGGGQVENWLLALAAEQFKVNCLTRAKLLSTNNKVYLSFQMFKDIFF